MLAIIAGNLTKDCWLWLYARFAKDSNGIFEITYNHIRDPGTIEEITEKLQPSDRIQDGSLADIAWNKQGMPIRKSRKQEFDVKNNISFYGPFDGSVAWFGVGSGGADLDCDRDPRYSDSALGVFACAAGAQNF